MDNITLDNHVNIELMERIRNICKSELFKDCSIHCKDAVIIGHRLILAAGGEKFAEQLTDESNVTGNIVFIDLSSEELVPIMDFIYTGEIDLTQYQEDEVKRSSEKLGIYGIKYYLEENETVERQKTEKHEGCNGA